jgi:hypothetical protein
VLDRAALLRIEFVEVGGHDPFDGRSTDTRHAERFSRESNEHKNRG